MLSAWKSSVRSVNSKTAADTARLGPPSSRVLGIFFSALSCAVMPWPWQTGKQLRVWRPSGEEAASVPISDNMKRVHQLKEHLHMLLGVPQLQQRIVHGNVILHDDSQLDSVRDVQLVVLPPSCNTSELDAARFLGAVYHNQRCLVHERVFTKGARSKPRCDVPQRAAHPSMLPSKQGTNRW